MNDIVIITIFIVVLCGFIGFRLTNSPYFLKNRIKDKNNLINDIFLDKEHWRQKYTQLAKKERVSIDPDQAKDVNAAIPDILNQFASSDPRLAKLLNNPAAMNFALGLAQKFPKEAEQVISAFISKVPKSAAGQTQNVSRL